MDVPFRLVDVFTPTPLAGNQLCVVPDPVGIDGELMQAVAREIGFSETTFVTEATADRYAMRIFTPDVELPFAGHPTLGTAFVLVREGRVRSPVTQVVRAGEIPVKVDLEAGTAWMTQLPPRFDPAFEDRDLVARAAGLTVDDLNPDLPVQVVSTGLPPLLVPVRDLATLRRARPHPTLVAEACERTGADELYLFAVGEGGVTARFFGATIGIVEDPATGSAAGPLAAYLAEHRLAGLPGAATIHQGEQVGRPSELHVEVTDRVGGSGRVGGIEGDGIWRVRVGGGVIVVGEGAFHL